MGYSPIFLELADICNSVSFLLGSLHPRFFASIHPNLGFEKCIFGICAENEYFFWHYY